MALLYLNFRKIAANWRLLVHFWTARKNSSSNLNRRWLRTTIGWQIQTSSKISKLLLCASSLIEFQSKQLVPSIVASEFQPKSFIPSLELHSWINESKSDIADLEENYIINVPNRSSHLKNVHPSRGPVCWRSRCKTNFSKPILD